MALASPHHMHPVPYTMGTRHFSPGHENVHLHPVPSSYTSTPSNTLMAWYFSQKMRTFTFFTNYILHFPKTKVICVFNILKVKNLKRNMLPFSNISVHMPFLFAFEQMFIARK
jgi:hypothetical protein